MTHASKITVIWYRCYGPSPFFAGNWLGKWLVAFFSSEGLDIPTKTAVVNDFGDLVEVPP